MAVFQLDIRPATRIAGVAALYHLKNSAPSDPRPNILRIGSSARNITRPGNGLAVTKNAEKNNKKPDACTADELHYVTVSNSEWKLALWRYLPSPKVLVLALAADAFVLFNKRIFFFFWIVWSCVSIHRQSQGTIRCCCYLGLELMLLDMISLLRWPPFFWVFVIVRAALLFLLFMLMGSPLLLFYFWEMLLCYIFMEKVYEDQTHLGFFWKLLGWSCFSQICKLWGNLSMWTTISCVFCYKYKRERFMLPFVIGLQLSISFVIRFSLFFKSSDDNEWFFSVIICSLHV